MIGKILGFLKGPFQRKSNEIFYKQFIGENKLFFDIGANVGFKTEVFRKLGVTVVSVEPQHSCFDILKNKFTKDDKVKLVNNGIGSQRGSLKIKISSSSSLISTFSDKWTKDGRFNNFLYDQEQDVEVITFEDLIADYGVPDFAKIDVEGYEYEVISGLKQKIPCLSFEFTSEFFSDSIKIIDYLTSLGYKNFNYGQGEKMKLKLNEWLDKDSFLRHILSEIESNKGVWGDIYVK